MTETGDLNQVAIIGMAGRFPGAGDVAAFWEQLKAGNECISSFTDAELLAEGVDPAQLQQPNYVKAKGVLEGADLFDAGFFGFSPREAEVMDPQQRVFLECAWEALESAGYDPYTFGGRIGVFAGASINTYLLFNLLRNDRALDSVGAYQTLIANDKDFLSTRVSYRLNLTGPSLTVQTACSTSLAAVHLACQSLINGECDVAIAGGVAISVPLKSGYLYEQGGVLSPDGHCRAFDARAAGTVSGNGVAIVVLRRLAEARENGDLVDAVILGSAMNNDGALKVGFTAPSVDGQTEVIAEAMAIADVAPETVGYVETHGTGTPLGDPIEVAALTRVFRQTTSERAYCALGSVKTNVGHLDAAAGATALIKAALSLRHQAIPASLHFERPNPELDLDSGPFFVNTELLPWPSDGAPRRAGVSSFGIGGTNVHLVLQEPPPRDQSGPSRPGQLLVLSARSEPALAAGAERLAHHLQDHPQDDLADTAYTLAMHRHPFEHRRAILCADRQDAIARLRQESAGPAEPSPAAGPTAPAVSAALSSPPVAFLFPGQGTQYPDMARGLYEHEAQFRQELDRCADLFREHLDHDILDLIFTGTGGQAPPDGSLHQTVHAQPALFAVEYALARTWMAWGVRPSAMIGHSVGEYVAACLADVFPLEDAVRLVAARGRLMHSMPRGAMLAVFLPESELERWLDDGLCLAAVNSPAACVVAGSHAAVDALERRLSEQRIASRRLHTSHAFHSSMMQGAVDPFLAQVRTTHLRAPQIPFCSNVTGTWIEEQQATSAAYWGSQLRHTVRLTDGLAELLRDPTMVLLEVGPGNSLSTFARQHGDGRAGRLTIAAMRHPDERRADREVLLESLGALWQAGVVIDWQAFYSSEHRNRVHLPAYPFQRRRYWVGPGPAAAERAHDTAPAVAGARTDAVGDWTYAPGWRRLPPAGGTNGSHKGTTTWLLLGTDRAIGQALASRLADAGGTVLRVSAGDRFTRNGERSWSIRPAHRKDFLRLLSELREEDLWPERVVHLWSLSIEPKKRLDQDSFQRAQERGFHSLLALGQGLDEVRTSTSINIDVLCRGVFSVTGAERLQPENATLLGPGTVIPQELANVSCRTLDITGPALARGTAGLVAALHEILLRPTEEAALAWRGQHWWARTFDPVQLGEDSTHPSRLRDGGVYLITGGLGGVGLALAETLARAATAPVLALLSRSDFPAEDTWPQWLETHDEADPTSVRINRLRELRELGATPVVLSADVADLEQTSQAVAEIRRRFGAVHGVIHAAGLPARGLIAGKSPPEADEVMAAKTLGTLVLDAVCGGDHLDFFLLCSSLTSVLGGPGQVDYCAANAFLDAFAQWRNTTGTAAVSAIGWDTWRETGMAAGLAARLGGPAAAIELDHPLLHQHLPRTGDSEVYLTTLTTARDWIVDEHRIMGHGLVPGTAYLELVRAAVRQHSPAAGIEFRDVLFTLPAIVPDGQTRTLYTTLDPREDGFQFRVQSRVNDPAVTSPGWQEHAAGFVRFHEPTDPPARDLDEVRESCRVEEVIDTDAELKRRLKLDMAEPGAMIQFAFGPRWRCLDHIHAGPGGILATLRLPDEYARELDACELHPALLDVAGAAARVHAGDHYYLPFWYGSLQIVRGLTSTVHCLVRLKESGDSSGETLTCDIDMLDPDGKLLVRIADFTMKRVNDVETLLRHIEQVSAMPGEETDRSDQGDPEQSALAVMRAITEGISADEGAEVFRRLLSTAELPAQVVVASKDLPTMQRYARSLNPARLAQEAAAVGPPRTTHPRPALATAYLAPETPTERAVAAIWQEVLGVEPVGLEDDFFALGGHSLAAVQIGARVRERFGVELALRDFFDSPTVANIIAVLAGAGDAQEAEADRIVPMARDEAADDLAHLADMSDEQVDAMLRQLITDADSIRESEG